MLEGVRVGWCWRVFELVGVGGCSRWLALEGVRVGRCWCSCWLAFESVSVHDKRDLRKLQSNANARLKASKAATDHVEALMQVTLRMCARLSAGPRKPSTSHARKATDF